MWESAAQLGAVAFIFVLFLVLLYKLADKYLSVWTATHQRTQEAEIETHRRMAETMSAMHSSLQQMSEFQGNNLREVLMAVKIIGKDVADMRREIREGTTDGIRNDQA